MHDPLLRSPLRLSGVWKVDKKQAMSDEICMGEATR